MSLTLHSATDSATETPARRRDLREAALREAGLLDGAPLDGTGSTAASGLVESATWPASSGIPAGWYPEPTASPHSRWWDGSVWTAELSIIPLTEPAPWSGVTTEAPGTEALSRRQFREIVGPLTSGGTTETSTALSFGSFGFSLPPDPFATPSAALANAPRSVVPSQFSDTSRSAARVTDASWTYPVARRSTTFAVLLLALMPAVQAALLWLVVAQLSLADNPVVRYLALGAPLILAVALGFADRRELYARGFPRTAPPVLALIAPLYLLVRIIRVSVAGFAPLLLWLLLQAAAAAFLLLHLTVLFALLPLAPTGPGAPVALASAPISATERAAQLTPTGMAAELTRQTLAKNLHFSSIQCPKIPSPVDGSTAVCVGTIASVTVNLSVLVSSALPTSAFSLVSESLAS